MSSPFRPALQIALDSAVDFLHDLDRRSVPATATFEELRARLYKPFPVDGLDPESVIADLVRDCEGGIVGSAGGRFFAWVIGGALPAALAADWMTSAWDQNSALYAAGPASAVVEQAAGEWLKRLLRLPQSASFALVTGCQMAHATCLAAARNSLLAARNWDVERKGLFGAPRIRILSSDQLHGTFERAVQLLGLGKDQIERLPVNELGQLETEALEQALLRDPESPTVVLLQAGDLNIGAFDDFRIAIPMAKRTGAWVHIDGAFGLWAGASARYAHYLDGADAADSWATDGHKWLNVPYDSGYAFIRDREAHRNAMSHRTSYMVHADSSEPDSARDQIDWTPEWSRRGRGFATYAALRQLGGSGVEELVNRCCEYAKQITAGIGALPGAEVLWMPTLNQGLVRFLSPKAAATEEDHSQRTDEVIRRILSDGTIFVGGTTLIHKPWRNKRAMRISVCNWQTNELHVEQAVDAVHEALKKLAAETE